MSNQVFYSKKLHAEEHGLTVVTYKFISIHETPCFNFCVPEPHFRLMGALKPTSETVLQYAKRRRLLKKVAKQCSRVAFETEEKALEHLRFLKKKQLGHMERETEFIKAFLKCEKLQDHGSTQIVPNSDDLVSEFLCFN